jgi:predicted nuclease of predicted toxin-antitoxin system
MNLLADESCAGPVIRALRAAGHDVVAVAEAFRGSTDEDVLKLALNNNRVLITEDRDFGELVYSRGQPSAGVLLLRFYGQAHHTKPMIVVEAVAKLGSQLRDAFTVVEPGRVRISNRP